MPRGPQAGVLSPAFWAALGPASRGPKRTQSGSPGLKLTSALPAGHEGALRLPLPPGCRALPVLSARPRPQEMPHFHELAPCGGELPRNQNCHCECGFGVKAWERASLYLSVTASFCSSPRCLWRMSGPHGLCLSCFPPQQAKDTFQNVTILSPSETLHGTQVRPLLAPLLRFVRSGPGLSGNPRPARLFADHPGL